MLLPSYKPTLPQVDQGNPAGAATFAALMDLATARVFHAIHHTVFAYVRLSCDGAKRDRDWRRKVRRLRLLSPMEMGIPEELLSMSMRAPAPAATTAGAGAVTDATSTSTAASATTASGAGANGGGGGGGTSSTLASQVTSAAETRAGPAQASTARRHTIGICGTEVDLSAPGFNWGGTLISSASEATPAAAAATGESSDVAPLPGMATATAGAAGSAATAGGTAAAEVGEEKSSGAAVVEEPPPPAPQERPPLFTDTPPAPGAGKHFAPSASSPSLRPHWSHAQSHAVPPQALVFWRTSLLIGKLHGYDKRSINVDDAAG